MADHTAAVFFCDVIIFFTHIQFKYVGHAQWVVFQGYWASASLLPEILIVNDHAIECWVCLVSDIAEISRHYDTD